MERTTSVEEAKKIFGKNFVGSEALSIVAGQIGMAIPQEVPPIPFSEEYLEEKKIRLSAYFRNFPICGRNTINPYGIAESLRDGSRKSGTLFL